MKLKKSLISLIAVGCLFSGFAMATPLQAGSGKPATQAHHGQHVRQNPMEKIFSQLNLTATQKKEITGIEAHQRKDMKAIRENTKLTKAQKRDQMRAIHKKSMESINKVLTKEQQAKLKQLMAERLKDRKNNHKKP